MKPVTEKLSQLPALPGCYIFKNKYGSILYIGKSKSLKNRVKQYFGGTDSSRGKYERLVREIDDVEIIITDTESDALILECELIKRHKPPYNSQLTRDKVYPYIKISAGCLYPSITTSDTVENDGAHYFGCFYSKDSAIQTIELINKIWKTPVCMNKSFASAQKSCLNYHINNCCAPCERLISPEAYNGKISEIVNFLHGNGKSTIRRLNAGMKKAANEMDFETAAYLRDCLFGLSKLDKQRRRFNALLKDTEVFLFFRAYNEKQFSIFYINNGQTLTRMKFDNMETIDQKKLQIFADNILNNVYEIENPSLLTKYLLEIHADKMFSTIRTKIGGNRLIKKLCSEFSEYIIDPVYKGER